MSKILALSSSRAGNSNYLEPYLSLISHFFGNKSLNIAFIPFASVDRDYEKYTMAVQAALRHLPHKIKTVTNENSNNVVSSSDAIVVGGGNTFKLLHDLYELQLLEMLQEKV